MDNETVPAAQFGHALHALSVNLLIRNVLTDVFAMQSRRISKDFAILLHAGQPFQLHADHTHHSHPLPSDSTPRGAGSRSSLWPEAGHRSAHNNRPCFR